MAKMIWILAASLVGGVLGGCASSDDRPASCRGALRGANPHGSVLQAEPPSAAAALSGPALGSPASALEAESLPDRDRQIRPGGAPP